MANQFRNYCLTINNPKETDEEMVEYIKKLPHVKYCVFQREAGAKCETVHFQMYIEFSLGKRFMVMKEYFPTAHIENRRGAKSQARDYCMKETKETVNEHGVSIEKRISGPYEIGEFVESGERSDINDIISMIESGATDAEIKKAYPSQYFRYYRNIHQIRQEFLEENAEDFRKLTVSYIYGSAGTGKTRYVMEKYGAKGVFRVTNYERGTFDLYKGQDVLCFDEFRHGLKVGEMLEYLDGYQAPLSARYNDKIALYTKVYIISNIPLSDQYSEKQRTEPATWQALMRRIHSVYNFDNEEHKQKLFNGDPNPNPLYRHKSFLHGKEVVELTDEEKAKMPF